LQVVNFVYKNEIHGANKRQLNRLLNRDVAHKVNEVKPLSIKQRCADRKDN